MTEENRKPDDQGPEAEQGQAAAQEAAAPGGAAAQEEPPQPEQAPQQPDWEAEVKRLQEQVADLTNRLLRARADYENYRRRAQRELEERTVYANQRLILEILPVLDNLDRALATPPTPGDERLRQGVELTARSFREILAKEGVTPIEAVGQPFDPKLHEALMVVESAEYPEGTVVLEFQKGYKLGDRVIRPSKVQVSKGAPAQSE